MGAEKSKKTLKQLILQLTKDNLAIRFVVRGLWTFFRRLRYFPFYAFCSVRKDVFLFDSFSGRQYSDNTRALYEEMIQDEDFKDAIFVWAFRNPGKDIPTNNRKVIQVKYDSFAYLKYFAKAIWVFSNSSFPLHVMRKKKQTLIQTWHGTPLKRLGCDIMIENYHSPYKTMKQTYKQYSHEGYLFDYLISPSPFTSEKLSKAFNLVKHNKSDIVLETGYPRNDYLYHYTEENIKQIKAKLKVPKDKKVLLYAPTWRDSEHDVKEGYTYFPDIDFDYLRDNLGSEYILLFRTHQFIEKTFDLKKYEDFIINVSSYDEISELYVISDMLITDYSSVFFDYANLRRPILYYMYDMDTYMGENRGFYLELDELPGPICKTEAELVKGIQNLAESTTTYEGKYRIFNEKFTPLDDGDASKRVIEILKFH